MTQTIEQLTARVRELETQLAANNPLLDEAANRIDELEEENARLKETLVDHGEIQKSLCENLSASQAYAEQLREALENHSGNYKLSKAECKIINDLLDKPRDTSALDTYVSEKVKEIIESHAPEGRNVTNAQHVEMRHKFLEQIATLTRQRDLAVEALEKYGRHDRNCEAVTEAVSECCGCGFNEALSTIKESEAMAQGEKK